MRKLKVYLDTSVIIHKIREYHYELTKDMTTQEKINFYNEGGRAFLKEMEDRKLQKV